MSPTCEILGATVCRAINSLSTTGYWDPVKQQSLIGTLILVWYLYCILLPDIITRVTLKTIIF